MLRNLSKKELLNLFSWIGKFVGSYLPHLLVQRIMMEGCVLAYSLLLLKLEEPAINYLRNQLDLIIWVLVSRPYLSMVKLVLLGKCLYPILAMYLLTLINHRLKHVFVVYLQTMNLLLRTSMK